LSSFVQEIDSDNPQDDFLTFIEQKTKTTSSMPELNPFANEFSFVNNKTLTNDSSITTNGIDHHTDSDNHSSYRLLFDNLIEKSLESIEAIKKSTKYFKKIIFLLKFIYSFLLIEKLLLMIYLYNVIKQLILLIVQHKQ